MVQPIIVVAEVDQHVGSCCRSPRDIPDDRSFITKHVGVVQEDDVHNSAEILGASATAAVSTGSQSSHASNDSTNKPLNLPCTVTWRKI